MLLTPSRVYFQGLLEMEFALPTDSTEASGLSLLRRLWVSRFDVEEEGRVLAEKYVFMGFLAPFLHQPNAPFKLKLVGLFLSLNLSSCCFHICPNSQFKYRRCHLKDV